MITHSTETDVTLNSARRLINSPPPNRKMALRSESFSPTMSETSASNYNSY